MLPKEWIGGRAIITGTDPKAPRAVSHVFIVALVAVVAYLSSLFGIFHYDDLPTIVLNPSIPRLDFTARFFYEPEHFSGIAGNGMYRPVLLLTYQADYFLYGFRGTAGWHLTNVLLHALNAALVVLLTRRVLRVLGGGGGAGGAAPILAGLLFALHPIQTEVVNYISSRSGAIATAGFLSALLAYLGATRGGGGIGRRVLLMAVALLLFLIGLGGKEVAIALVPAVLLLELLDPAGGGAFRRIGRAALRGLPLLVVAVAYMAWRKHVLSEDLAGLASRVTEVSGKADLFAGGGRTVLQNLLTQSRVFWMYVGLLFFPTGLAVDHFVRVSTSFTEPVVLASVAGLIVLTGLLLSQWRRRPAVTFAGFLVFFGLAPTSSVIPLNVVMNEHRMYLPGVGAAMLFGMAVAPFAAARPRAARALLLTVGVALLALVTLRNLEWRTQESLWEANVRVSPRSYRGHNQLGSLRKEQAGSLGLVPAAVPILDEALREFELAIEQYPEWYDPWFNQGLTYIDRAMITKADEDWDRSIARLEKACEVSRRKPWRARYWIANAWGIRGRPEQAIRLFLALADEDRDAEGRRKPLYLYPVGRLRLSANELDAAEKVYREIVTSFPKEEDAYAGLARTLTEAGRNDEAEEVIRSLLSGPAKKSKAHLAAAGYYFGIDPAKAGRHFQRAVEAGHHPTPQEMQKYLGGV